MFLYKQALLQAASLIWKVQLFTLTELGHLVSTPVGLVQQLWFEEQQALLASCIMYHVYILHWNAVLDHPVLNPLIEGHPRKSYGLGA